MFLYTVTCDITIINFAIYTQIKAAKIGAEAEVRRLLDEGKDPDSHENNKVCNY